MFSLLIEYTKSIILLKTASKNSNPVKSYGDLFMIHTSFPMIVASLEMCIDLVPQWNVYDAMVELKF